MTQYLLDTNHLSPLVTLTHPLRKRIISELQVGQRFGLAIPTLTEMIFGISSLPRAKQNLIHWAQLEAKFVYYDLDKQDGLLAAELQTTLRKRGRQLATVDALIAAIALRYDLTLLTTDKDFAPLTALRQENWVA